jgi:replicative DNA helicase
LPRFANLSNFTDCLKEKTKYDSLIRAANLITSDALEEEDEVDALIDRAESAIFSIRDTGAKDSLARIIHTR